MLAQLLTALTLVPFLGFIGCILVPKEREDRIYSVVMSAIALELALFVALVWRWLSVGAHPIATDIGTLYKSGHYSFVLDFYFDRLSAVFFGTAIVMAILIFIFSKNYMHREQGFKRFYYTVTLFFAGLSLTILAGNFEVLLLGWELIGITSVLLIAFYRDRVLPAKNALKVFSTYRIADAFLLASIWYAFHLFGGSVHFSELSSVAAQHGNRLAVLGLLLLVVALIKSAQFPFSYWLPRAMEGPTTSSAIFYGAMSVHMGLFLLLRTYPLWQGSIWLRVVIAMFGLITAIAASSIARVQSTIKTQIAYASITQIGIMFIEVAVGLQWLALIHFVSNVSLRTYQLLISPSVVGYLVHDQFFYFVPPVQKINSTLLGKIKSSLYVLGVEEWNMNTAISHYVWGPLKLIGRSFAFLDTRTTQVSAALLFLTCATIIATVKLPASLILVASIATILVSIVFYIRAFATKSSAMVCWNLVLLGHLFGALFLAMVSDGTWKTIVMYGVGVAVAFIVGSACLRYLELKGESIALQDYHGSIYAFKALGHVFFIICLLFMAFPISPSFLAQDFMLSLIPEQNVFLVVLFGISYLLVGVDVMRIYAKTFFGPHKTGYHEIAYKSS